MPRPVHLLRLALVVAWLAVLPVLPTPAADGALPRPSIARHLVSMLETQGQADILIVMRQQVDLSPAARLASKDARAGFVWQALRAVAASSQRQLLSSLEERGIPYRSYYLVNMVLVHAGRDLLDELAARPDVARLEANPLVRVALPEPKAAVTESLAAGDLPWGLRRVQADQVWSMGIRGQGVVVAGADTGALWTHEALQRSYRGWDGTSATHGNNWHDAVYGRPEPYDDHGHGTLTLGTAVGGDPGQPIGMAPDARWIACKNMDSDGYGTPARYIECFEFFLAPYPEGSDPMTAGDPVLAPDVVNNSWSCPGNEGCGPATLRSAVEALRAAGIVVVASAGNEGAGGCGTVQYPPAIYDAAFTVAAFRAGDTIAGFSSRGPVVTDGSGRRKPDVAAPGVGILTSASSGGYELADGTSLAAPHVAGQIALMLSANPDLRGRVDDMEMLIETSAQSKAARIACGGEASGAVPNNTWGHGIIDALKGVQAAQAWPHPPTQTPTATATATAVSLPTASDTPTLTATATPAATATCTPDMPWRVYVPVLTNADCGCVPFTAGEG